MINRALFITVLIFIWQGQRPKDPSANCSKYNQNETKSYLYEF